MNNSQLTDEHYIEASLTRDQRNADSALAPARRRGQAMRRAEAVETLARMKFGPDDIADLLREAVSRGGAPTELGGGGYVRAEPSHDGTISYAVRAPRELLRAVDDVACAALEMFTIRAEGPVQRDLELACFACGALIRGIGPGDLLGALARTAREHSCEGGGPVIRQAG